MPTLKKTCAICLDNIWFNTGKQLRCNHIFHADCVKKICEYKRQCPLCETYIFDDISAKISITTNPSKLQELIGTLSKDQLYPLMKEATSKNLVPLENALITHIATSKEIIDELIETGNVTVLQKLLESNKVNCHMTIKGQTLVERALITQNENIINLVLDHCKPANEPKGDSSFNTLTTCQSPYPIFYNSPAHSPVYPPLTPTAPPAPIKIPPPRPPPPRVNSHVYRALYPSLDI